jgi:glutamate decarboxylase
MVHLTTTPSDEEIKNSLPEAVQNISLQLSTDEDTFTTNVYGSRFAAEDLPRHEIPDREMPREIAYKMIKDELSLDGNPMLK